MQERDHGVTLLRRPLASQTEAFLVQLRDLSTLADQYLLVTGTALKPPEVQYRHP